MLRQDPCRARGGSSRLALTADLIRSTYLSECLHDVINTCAISHSLQQMQDVDAKDEADAIDALLSAADRPGMGAIGIVSRHPLYPSHTYCINIGLL